MTPVASLKPGNRFRTRNTVVTVLTEIEHGTETVPPLTGLPCIRLYGRRDDTCKEGTMIFGPSAEVDLIPDGS